MENCLYRTNRETYVQHIFYVQRTLSISLTFFETVQQNELLIMPSCNVRTSGLALIKFVLGVSTHPPCLLRALFKKIKNSINKLKI